MIFAWGVAANIGLAIGPIYSIYITETISWYVLNVPYNYGTLLTEIRRWVFWIAAVVEFAQGILSLFLKEPRPSQILKKLLQALNKATKLKTSITIDNPDESVSCHEFITNSLTRPIRLFFMEPIVLFVTIMCDVAFGQIYLFTEALPVIYTQPPLSFTTKPASLYNTDWLRKKMSLTAR